MLPLLMLGWECRGGGGSGRESNHPNLDLLLHAQLHWGQINSLWSAGQGECPLGSATEWWLEELLPPWEGD